MADKNTHNYDAGVAAGRKQFARELQMSIDANPEATPEELLDLLQPVIYEEANKP